ncbi:unnamed protein product [Camellia sinensis]
MCAFMKLVQAWSFGHHALRCLIGGLRAKRYTPLSLRNDEESGSTYISCKMPCFASVVLCCSKNNILEKQVADRPPKLADWPVWVADVDIPPVHFYARGFLF